MLGRFAAGICCSKQTPQIFWHSKHIIIHTTTYWHKIWGLSSDSPPKRTVVLWKLSILIESLKSNTTGSNPRAVPGLSHKEHCYFGVVCARHCKKIRWSAIFWWLDVRDQRFEVIFTCHWCERDGEMSYEPSQAGARPRAYSAARWREARTRDVRIVSGPRPNRGAATLILARDFSNASHGRRNVRGHSHYMPIYVIQIVRQLK